MDARELNRRAADPASADPNTLDAAGLVDCPSEVLGFALLRLHPSNACRPLRAGEPLELAHPDRVELVQELNDVLIGRRQPR